MAINLLFRLKTETEQDVTYQFGNPGRLNRELTIRKSDYTVTVADGRTDQLAILTAGKAMSRHKQDGTWMKSGSVQA
ncbi:hypothetical protein DFR69_103358 [Nocardia neocaledoniensis]|uniref:Uncharacterized protein n=1 Tax=Nocardia neocaledoniensis TaxID=236511 RepID=A0A317NR75_9NOCA|nr:hypothetical protein DFR69_103358 [Nocardia neocaledoniensis]